MLTPRKTAVFDSYPYTLKFSDVGIDRCYRCKKTREGGWLGKGKSRDFQCLVCVGRHFRRYVKSARDARA